MLAAFLFNDNVFVETKTLIKENIYQVGAPKEFKGLSVCGSPCFYLCPSSFNTNDTHHLY